MKDGMKNDSTVIDQFNGGVQASYLGSTSRSSWQLMMQSTEKSCKYDLITTNTCLLWYPTRQMRSPEVIVIGMKTSCQRWPVHHRSALVIQVAREREAPVLIRFTIVCKHKQQ